MEIAWRGSRYMERWEGMVNSIYETAQRDR